MSLKPLALFLDRASVYPGDLDFSALDDVAQWRWFDNADVSLLRGDLLDAEIIVSNKVPVNSELINSCRQLKLICVAATGFNNIDVDAAHRRGIVVSNVRAYATASVVQHVFSMILSLNRKLSSYRRAVADGSWSRSQFFCCFGEQVTDLQGKTLGIVGYGELGKAVARVAQCFGMRVLVSKRNRADTRADRVTLTELLSAADVVSLHCPLTADNHHLIGENELALMKPDAILINAARGGLVDEAALLETLQNNRLAGAALDVLEQEPPPENHPLTRYPGDNLIITPHIAWASQQSRQELVDQIADNIRHYLLGKPVNIV